MNKFKTLLIGVFVSVFIFGVYSPQSFAQTNEQAKTQKSDEERQFSADAGRIVLEAQELMSGDQYEAALNKLAQALSLENISAYENSIIYQMQGSCFYELDQYEQAIKAFKSAVASDGLLKSQKRALEFNIAQLLIATDQFEQGAVLIEKWHRQGGTFKKGHLEMLWQAWSQAGKYERALPWAEQWFNAAGNAKTRKHFDTLNFLYNSLGMPEKQIDVVEQMLEKWPADKTLWDVLASLLANNGKEQDAFELKLRQYHAGLLTDESALLQLVQYHSFYGIPFQGGQLMERELALGRISITADHYNELADLWRQAREYDRAIPVLEQAVTLSGRDAAPALSKLAEAQYHQGNCSQAKNAIEKIKPTGNSDLASLYTQLGVCYYEKSQDFPKAKCGDDLTQNSARFEFQKRALDAFTSSTAHKQGRDKSVHKTALSWTNFIKGEKASSVEFCNAIIVAEQEQCFKHIDEAYRLRALVGDVIIDESCLRFKDEFDAKFRQPLDAQ